MYISMYDKIHYKKKKKVMGFDDQITGFKVHLWVNVSLSLTVKWV